VVGKILYTVSASNTVGLGLTFPGMKQCGGFFRGMQTITQGGDSYSTTRGMQAIFNENASGSIVFSTVPAASATTYIVDFDALFVTSTAGTIQLQARASATATPMICLGGSYM